MQRHQIGPICGVGGDAAIPVLIGETIPHRAQLAQCGLDGRWRNEGRQRDHQDLKP